MNQVSSSVIRRAKVADAELLAELGARTFSDTFAADNSAENMAAYLASSFSPALQAAELAEPGSIFLIAEMKGIAAGYAKLKSGEAPEGVCGKDPIELVRLYVCQQWHGCGVGPSLMRACLDEATLNGNGTLWLGVWEHNLRARAFYGKWDFRDVGRHIFQLGDDAQTDVLMERSL